MTTSFDSDLGPEFCRINDKERPAVQDVRHGDARLQMPFIYPAFTKWTGAEPNFGSKTIGNKPLCRVNDAAMLAEIALVTKLNSSGYSAVWIDNFHRRVWSSMKDHLPLSEFIESGINNKNARETFLKLLSAKKGSRGGLWDVFAWNGIGAAGFFELKLRKNDRLGEKQLDTFKLAQTVAPSLSFYVAEWDWD
jgi:hypothetical protein